MGINIELQDETGCALDAFPDPKGIVSQLLPLEEELEDYPLLSGIDPYGDTVFNRVQMPRFLTEWTKVASRAETDEGRTVASEVARLALLCSTGVHTYLKFIGD